MAALSARTETIQLGERIISYRRLGHGGKRKILFFHGFPSSSAQVAAFSPFREAMELDVVCMDRPGYHLSQAVPAGQDEETSERARLLLQAIDWNSCEAVSVSGGTPFLFSFVRENPDLVSGISIVSGLGPINSPEFRRVMRWRARMGLRLFPLLPGSLLKKALPHLSSGSREKGPGFLKYVLPASEADLASLAGGGVRSVLLQSLVEAFAQNGSGPRKDAQKYLRPWRADLGNYRGPVDIWHGTEDRVIPVEMAHRLAKAIPGAKLHLLEGQGHYSPAISGMKEILSARR
jgi:pimeloyl-ACP methyl ester carboxylesterase